MDAVVYAAVLIAASAFSLALFYRQTLGGVDSDMKAYILEMQGLDSGYSFPYPVFFKLAGFIHLFAEPGMSVAIATMLLNGLGMIVVKFALDRLALPLLEEGFRVWSSYGNTEGVSGSRRKASDTTWLSGFRRKVSSMTWLPRVAVSFLSFSLFFISMLYPPKGIYLPGIRFRYVGVFTANPFHNATYMAARPFAILAFLWYVKLLPVYEKGIAASSGLDYLLFSLFLLLATMTKPSFTLVMVSAAGLLMLYRLFRARFRNLIPTLQLSVCFVPTFLDLLYQYTGVFVPEEGQERGLGFCFGEVWADYCDNIPLGICLAVGFPLLVLVFHVRECRKNSFFGFSWLLYLVSFAEAFFLYEKGFRKVDFNFSWGYMYGIFFCHFGALLLLLQETAGEMKNSSRPGGKHRVCLAVQWLAYFCHVLCGLLYFSDLLNGGTYY